MKQFIEVDRICLDDYGDIQYNDEGNIKTKRTIINTNEVEYITESMEYINKRGDRVEIIFKSGRVLYIKNHVKNPINWFQ